MEIFTMAAAGNWMRPLAIAIGLSGVLAACSPSEESSAPAAAPPSVTVAAAVQQEIRQSATFVGQIEAVDNVNLISRVSGFLDSKEVRDGATAKAGELLFTIERAPYEAALASAKAEAARAEAEAALKTADLERDKDLYEKGHVSKAKYQATLAAKEQAEAAVDAANAAVTQADLNLAYTEIHAPFDGQLGKTNFSVGDVVGPSSGPIARLVRTAPMYVSFSISERDYLEAVRGNGSAPQNLDEIGKHPDIHIVLPNGQKYGEDGEIVFIDNAVDPATGTIAIRGQFPNADRLLVAGTFVTVVIEAGDSAEEVVIPQSAVQRDQTGPFVLVIGSQENVEQRRVELGEQVDTKFVVKKGLQEGERVITEGLQKVRPGVPVNAVLADDKSE
ncbi:efflux RND transporter periplasmic adaptor subunit [Stappia stellulata]|uniref:efflux RND transporter periplasmic adaptor subunit n=1 Tax=Stappia stellulata TaxID=71235 RepID=UPI001CD32A37|nr:efflux RND transporter periplasmic adaptor subunit [Stappia stellulata]MCA1241882.1 efflux RND transporter periplasmic adaptor subunit [Stappia stellulata]